MDGAAETFNSTLTHCENCLFANYISRPGPAPEPIYRSFLGLFAWVENPPPHVTDSYNLHKHLHTSAMQCQRYPKVEIVGKKYCCGEFKDKYNE